jgi:hypothetical protein
VNVYNIENKNLYSTIRVNNNFPEGSHIPEVGGSIPLPPTRDFKGLQDFAFGADWPGPLTLEI